MELKWLDDYTLLVFDRIDSTNLEAKRLIRNGAKDKCIVLAYEQQQGRGKNDSFWYSPTGNLYLSLFFQHKGELREASQVSLVAGLACCKAINTFLNSSAHQAKMKWPNDLLINSKKFCGILVESITNFSSKDQTQSRYLIIGMGINLTQSPKYLSYQATSLVEENIQYMNSNEVLARFMEHFHAYYKLWLTEGFGALRDEWMSHGYNIGKKISCKMGEQNIAGLFKEIDQDGRLVVELETGDVYKMSSAEVFF